MIRFICALFIATQSFAMMSDGVHNPQDYRALAEKFTECDAVGLLRDNATGGMQTCVLISKNTILTAAHGVENNKNPSTITITFETKNGKQSHRASHVHVDARYDREQRNTLDFALITLENDVSGIEPAKILPSINLKQNDILLVATYGNKDIDPMFAPKKRAFYLMETDRYYHQGHEPSFKENIALSSIYFAPYSYKIVTEESFWEKLGRIFFGGASPLTEDEAEYMNLEILPRMREALQNWKRQGKPPYALALPGSSGAPVFLKCEGKFYLVGMITSFSHLSSPIFDINSAEKLADTIMNTKKEKLYGHFQTVFTLLYKVNQNSVYTIDKSFKNFATE